MLTRDDLHISGSSVSKWEIGRAAVGGRVREFTWNFGTVYEGCEMQLPQLGSLSPETKLPVKIGA